MAIATRRRGDTDGDAALALDGLEDQKQLATVAKSSPHDTVRTAALGRVHDVKALSSVARHAADTDRRRSTRCARIADAPSCSTSRSRPTTRTPGSPRSSARRKPATPGDELRDTLEAVAARAKNKSVQSGPGQ